MSSTKLSLRSAIFINLNIILGTGIFLNTALLAQHVGPWGWLTYLTVGIILLPLILSLAELVRVHEGGSFYDYAAPLHPAIGFVSQWCYFVGKTAACTLGIHVFSSLIKSIFIPLAGVPTLALDSLIILLFLALNMLNLRINKTIQMAFFVLKIIPVFFIIIAGIIFFSPAHLINTSLNFGELFVTIPFALYAFTGFEATCSLIHTLENPQKDGPRAILYSYSLSVFIAIVFQTMLYMLVGPQLHLAESFLQTFPAVYSCLFPLNSFIQTYGVALIHTAIACSALGASYGVLFSNGWNLFTLAEKKLMFNAHTITRLTKHGVPYVCVVAQGVIALTYLWYTQGDQVSLQQTNILALTCTYSFSALGLCFIALTQKDYRRSLIISLGGCLSCSFLLGFLIKNFIYYRAVPALPFVFFLLFGIISFLANFKKHQRTQT